MKIAICLVGLFALAAASVYPTIPKKTVDQQFLTKQKQVLQLTWRLTQPLAYPYIQEIADSYDIQANLDKYTNVEAVKNFVTTYKRGFLPKDEVFSIFNEYQKEEVISLFELFYYAKDFDTFYKTAAWARVNVNPSQFYYAFNVAIFNRDDTKGIILPPVYEVYPQLFVDNEVVQKAYEYRMLTKTGEGNNAVVIPVNKTGMYPYYQYQDYKKYFEYPRNVYGYDYLYQSTPEDRLSYFTEDIGLNAYYNYFHLENPFWLNATYGFKSERRGELFYYTNQQLLARYILERFSNDLLDIDALNFEYPIGTGYNPKLRYPNGKDFPVRPDNYDVSQFNNYEVQLVQDFERRIRDAIDLGYVFTQTGEKIHLTEYRGLDILGQMIESTADSVNYNYYGKLYQLSLQLLGRIVDYTNYNRVAPGVVEQYETVLRDPAYYRFLVSITRLFLRYKSLLPSYYREQLTFPGVKIESVDVEKLITYFEPYEFDVSGAVMTPKKDEDYYIKARQYRLNNKPFTYKINVQSDKAVNAVVRVFIGPKYDSEGRVLNINEKRRLMVELDKFPYQLSVGQNTIARNSKDIFTSGDFPSFRDMYQTVNDALQGKAQWTYEEVQCGFPYRFLLPKGKRGGMPFTFYVTVTPTNTESTEKVDTAYYGCGSGFGLVYQDQNAMGYPFDRVIDEKEFYVPNFYEKDVIIFHKRGDDINNQSN